MTTTKPCPLCDSTGPWPSNAERMAHIRAHHTATCPQCGASVNESGLQAHLLHVHDEDGSGRDSDPKSFPPEVTPAPPEDAAPADEVEPGMVECPDCGRTVGAQGLGPHRAAHRRAEAAGRPVVRHDAPPEPLTCGECGEGPFADRRALAGHTRSHQKVRCPDCGIEVGSSGIGSHRRRHPKPDDAATPARPSAARAQPTKPPPELGPAIALLLPGAAGELVDRLAVFVAKHQPMPGEGRWIVAPLDGKGPWLCRTGGVGLVVAREHVGALVVAVDDIYAVIGRPTGNGSTFHAGQSWPHPKAGAS